MSDFDKFIDKLLTGLFWLMMTFAVGFFVYLAVYLIPRDIDRTNRAQGLGKQMGCEFIGSARDLNSVKFFDCNGEIVIKRVK